MLFRTLSQSIALVCARDPTVLELKFTSTCFENLKDFVPNEDFDEEDSYDGLDIVSRRNNDILASEFAGGREWYCELAVMISQLERLRVISFESLDPNETDLEKFWGEYAASTSLRLVVCIDMDLTSCEEVFTMFSAPHVKAVEFERCIICISIGFMLGENVNENNRELERELTFNECNFRAVSDSRCRREFVDGLGWIPGLRSVKFKRCIFVDDESKRRFFGILIGSFDNDMIIVED